MANKPLTNKQLEEIINAPDFYDTASDWSESEVEDNVEYEPFEDSGSEYVPSDDDSNTDDSLPGPSKRFKKTEEVTVNMRKKNICKWIPTSTRNYRQRIRTRCESELLPNIF